MSYVSSFFVIGVVNRLIIADDMTSMRCVDIHDHAYTLSVAINARASPSLIPDDDQLASFLCKMPFAATRL